MKRLVVLLIALSACGNPINDSGYSKRIGTVTISLTSTRNLDDTFSEIPFQLPQTYSFILPNSIYASKHGVKGDWIHFLIKSHCCYYTNSSDEARFDFSYCSTGPIAGDEMVVESDSTITLQVLSPVSADTEVHLDLIGTYE